MLLCLTLAGCTVGPNYRHPETPRRRRWQESKQTGSIRRRRACPIGGSEFNDPLLNSLVARAVKSNLDLASPKRGSAKPARRLMLPTADYWPTLNSAASYTRNRASQNAVGSSGQGAVAALGGPAVWNKIFLKPVSMPAGRSTFLAARVGAWKPLRRTSGIGGRPARRAGHVARRRGKKLYRSARFAAPREVIQANLKAQQESLDLTHVRFDAGLASDLEVAQAEGQVSATAAQIPTLQSALKQTAYRLDVLLGAQPGTLSGELSKETPIPALPPQAHVGIPADLLRRRPDIRRTERNWLRLPRKSARPPRISIQNFP